MDVLAAVKERILVVRNAGLLDSTHHHVSSSTSACWPRSNRQPSDGFERGFDVPVDAGDDDCHEVVTARGPIFMPIGVGITTL